MSTLNVGEYHPAANSAARWIRALPLVELLTWQEAFSSSAMSGDRCAELCNETLRRFIAGEPVSDRYLLALAWTIRAGAIAPPLPLAERYKSKEVQT